MSSNKVAIVAGAGGGIGLNVAEDLLKDGAAVCMADLKPAPANINANSDRELYLSGDLGDEGFVRSVVESTISKFGHIDYLVNTTGVLWFDRDKSLVDMDFDVWDEVFRINLKSHALMARQVIPHMEENGSGAMVHFSSIDALVGDRSPQDAYGASKAALIRLSKSIAVQFASKNIRSNCILPGPVLSPMQARWDNRSDLKENVAKNIPLGRIGATQDMADACLYLLSDKASFITGTELIVDGGISAGG